MSGKTDAAQPEAVAQPADVHVPVRRVEDGPRGRGRADWRHQVAKLRGAAVDPCRRVRDFEPLRQPHQRSLQRLEAVFVHAGLCAGERTFELAASLEQVEHAREIAIALETPALLREEDLPHAREVHPRFHLPCLLWPVPEVDRAGHLRPRSVGDQLHLAEPGDARLDREAR
jgi:hypothetical protein